MIPQVTTGPTSTMKVPTAPMSWKDVVKRAPPKVKTPAVKATAKPTLPTTPRAARSRSISRIVPSNASTGGAKTSTPKNGDKPTPMARRPIATKQVSFKSVPLCKDDEHEVSTHPMADLIDRLGLTGPRLPRDRVSVEERRRNNGGRSRSASADEVLLRRAMPLWLMEAQAQSNVMCTKGKTTNQPRKSRKERAMSVPNAALVAMDCCHKALDEDSSDCDDTHSESTSDSSCMSPRHVPVTQFVESHDPCLLDIPERSSMATADSFAEYMTPEDEEEDMEALELLDRINSLAAEFKAHREYEESSAVAWSVQHAARQGVLSPQLQQSLLTNIRNGSWEEARDVLYHKCHLVPAVASMIDHPNQPPLDPNASASFEEYVEQISPPESAEMKRQKLGVLKTLSDLLTRWVRMIGYERGLSEEHIALTGGSLFLAGSYRLGLHDSESDIDAVCVVPWHVTYEDFFSSFCQMLESTPGVTQLAPVPHAYVPLISLSFEGVSMDLLFARLPMTMVESHQDIDSDHILVGVDPSSMKSLNAPRVSSMLLCLVPRGHVFRIVLRAVRTWARRRGVYSAKLGYLGGISWAILVAFVCQMYPDAEPVKVLVRFFQVFSEWQWPRPVMLNMVYDAGLGFEMWDPRQNLYDSAHIMPIITPAYPHMNSAVQVTHSTYSVIFEELWRARYLAEIAAGPLRPICPPMTPSMPSIPPQPSTSPDTTAKETNMVAISTSGGGRWEKLFQQSNFFIRYGTYLVVNFYAASDNSMHAWGKFVQSRLRKLVESLQHVSSIVRVHAFPCFYPHTNDGQTPGSCMFIGVEFQTRHGLHTQAQVRNDPEVKSNLERTIRFFLATDLQQLAGKQEDMGADATVLDWSELPDYVFPRGRATAEAERAEYYQDIERMLMQQPVQHPMPMRNHSMDKFGVPKWRSGPRGRFPNGKGKQSRGYRDKSGYIAQAG